jgi:hypothetical protein
MAAVDVGDELISDSDHASSRDHRQLSGSVRVEKGTRVTAATVIAMGIHQRKACGKQNKLGEITKGQLPQSP